VKALDELLDWANALAASKVEVTIVERASTELETLRANQYPHIQIEWEYGYRSLTDKTLVFPRTADRAQRMVLDYPDLYVAVRRMPAQIAGEWQEVAL